MEDHRGVGVVAPGFLVTAVNVRKLVDAGTTNTNAVVGVLQITRTLDDAALVAEASNTLAREVMAAGKKG